VRKYDIVGLTDQRRILRKVGIIYKPYGRPNAHGSYLLYLFQMIRWKNMQPVHDQ
jgi:hypothetical protein